MKQLVLSMVLGIGIIFGSQAQRIQGEFTNGRLQFAYGDNYLGIVLYSGGYNLGGYEIMSPRITNNSDKSLSLIFSVTVYPNCGGEKTYTFNETVGPGRSKGGNTGLGAYELDMNFDGFGCKQFDQYSDKFKSMVSAAKIDIKSLTYK